jgi:hypothetical protein
MWSDNGESIFIVKSNFEIAKKNHLSTNLFLIQQNFGRFSKKKLHQYTQNSVLRVIFLRKNPPSFFDNLEVTVRDCT